MKLHSIRHPLLWLGLLVAALGCQREPTAPPSDASAPKQAPPVRILVVDDPPLAEAIEQQWNTRAEGEATVAQISSEQIAELRAPRLGGDLVIYPSSLLGRTSRPRSDCAA